MAWVDPKEGPIAQMNYFDVIKGAPHPTLAQAFIDHVLSEEVQLVLAERHGFGSVNKNVKLPPDVAAKAPSLEAIEKAYRADWAYINSVVDKWIDRATRELGK